jgi:hypothetical protein
MKMKPTVDKLSEDMAKVGKEQEDLRKSVLSLRENEVFQLRQQADALDSKYKQAVAYATAVLLAISALGYTKLEDVNKGIDKLVDTKLEESLGNTKERFREASYAELENIKRNMAELQEKLKNETAGLISFNETLQAAVLDRSDSPAALRDLKKLARLKPQNEMVFRYLTDHCYKYGKYHDAFAHFDYLRDKGISLDGFTSRATLVNAGILMWIRSFHESPSENLDGALRCLKKAKGHASEKAEDEESDQSTTAMRSWYFLALLHLSQNRCPEAEACASQYQVLSKEMNRREDLSGDTKKEWFGLLEKKCDRPIRQDLERMFPGCFPRAQQDDYL